MFTRKNKLLADTAALAERVRQLETDHKVWLQAAVALETRLNILDKRTSEIACQYEKILIRQKQILNAFDVLKKENTAFTTWLRNLGSRIVDLEKDER